MVRNQLCSDGFTTFWTVTPKVIHGSGIWWLIHSWPPSSFGIEKHLVHATWVPWNGSRWVTFISCSAWESKQDDEMAIYAYFTSGGKDLHDMVEWKSIICQWILHVGKVNCQTQPAGRPKSQGTKAILIGGNHPRWLLAPCLRRSPPPWHLRFSEVFTSEGLSLPKIQITWSQVIFLVCKCGMRSDSSILIPFHHPFDMLSPLRFPTGCTDTSYPLWPMPFPPTKKKNIFCLSFDGENLRFSDVESFSHDSVPTHGPWNPILQKFPSVP